MSELLFKGELHTLKSLIKLRSESPLYKKGLVVDNDTGEELDISEIDRLRELYIDELISFKDKERVYNNKKSTDKMSILEDKYQEDNINRHELLELIQLKNKFEMNSNHNKKRQHLMIYYDNFYTVNMGKDKPKELSHSDYGKFFRMLNFIATEINTIQYKSNGKKIKEIDLANHLEFKGIKSFRNFLTKLNKSNLVAKGNRKNDRYIHINPAYAQRKIKIDQTLYELFKDDLKEFLSEYEIKYFEMCDDIEDIPSTIVFS